MLTVTQEELVNNGGHIIKTNAIEHLFSMVPLCAVTFKHYYSGRVSLTLRLVCDSFIRGVLGTLEHLASVLKVQKLKINF